jgi:hypothetical protein
MTTFHLGCSWRKGRRLHELAKFVFLIQRLISGSSKYRNRERSSLPPRKPQQQREINAMRIVWTRIGFEPKGGNCSVAPNITLKLVKGGACDAG